MLESIQTWLRSRNGMGLVLGLAIGLLIVAVGLAVMKRDAADVAVGAQEVPFLEGTHYATLPEPIDLGSDQITVTEFFWYGCPHCQRFEPLLNQWLSTAPDDVVFFRSPVVWRPGAMELHAKTYFLATEAEQSVSLHEALFVAIDEYKNERNLFKQEKALAEVFAKHDFPAQTYLDRLRDPGLEGLVEQAVTLSDKAGIGGTPSMIVDGRYRVLNDSIRSNREMLEVVDFLIELARAQRLSATAAASS